MLPSVSSIQMNCIARFVSMADMGVMVFSNLFLSPYSHAINLVSYFFAVLVMLIYVGFDFFYYRELKTASSYRIVLSFCILSAISCVLNFGFDFHIREIVRFALDLYIFYLVPVTWNKQDVEVVIRFSFDSLLFFLTLIIIALFCLFVKVAIYGNFSIMESTYHISANRLVLELNPNTIGSIALVTIILCVYKIISYGKNYWLKSLVILVGFISIVLLLASQSRASIISLIIFSTVFFFLGMQINKRYRKKSKIKLFVSALFFAILLFLACVILITLIYSTLLKHKAITSYEPISSFQRLTIVKNNGFSGRTDIWVDALHAIMKNPILGCDFSEVLASEGPLGYHHGYTHNLLLQIALYCGLPCAGIAAFLVTAYLFGFVKKGAWNTFEVLAFSSVFALVAEYMVEGMMISFLTIAFFSFLGAGVYCNGIEEQEAVFQYNRKSSL